MQTESSRAAPGPFVFVAKAVLVIGAFALGARLAVDALLFPWSLPLPGRGTLVGEWYGEVLTPTGKKQHLALTLEAQTERCSGGCYRLKAVAQLCERGAEREYTGLGTVDNWRGTLFHVSLSPSETAPPGSRYLRLNGEWNADLVQSSLSFGPLANPHVASVSEATDGARADPDGLFAVPVALRRGSERDFHAACRRL